MNKDLQRRRQRRFIYIVVILVILSFLLSIVLPLWAGEGKAPLVVLKGPITPILCQRVENALRLAERVKAPAMVIEMNCQGGSTESLIALRKIAKSRPVPIIVFIDGQATSTACLLALMADSVYMTSQSSLGSSDTALWDLNNEVEKANKERRSLWKAEVEAAALAHDRDPALAAGLLLPNPVTGKSGNALSASEAVKYGFCDGLAKDRDQALIFAGLAPEQVKVMQPGRAEQTLNWMILPQAAIPAIALGILFLVVEMVSFGWGIPGTIGIILLGSYISAQYLANSAGWFTLVMFGLGFILVLVEMLFVPGLGLPGILGLLSMAGALVLASGGAFQGWNILWISTLLSLVLVLSYLWLARPRLPAATEEVCLHGLAGQTGETLSRLAPRGTIIVKGRRVRARTFGDPIGPGQMVQVTGIYGSRVVVVPCQDASLREEI